MDRGRIRFPYLQVYVRHPIFLRTLNDFSHETGTDPAVPHFPAHRDVQYIRLVGYHEESDIAVDLRPEKILFIHCIRIVILRKFVRGDQKKRILAKKISEQSVLIPGGQRVGALKFGDRSDIIKPHLPDNHRESFPAIRRSRSCSA